MKKRHIIESSLIAETPQFRLKKQTLMTHAGTVHPHYYLLEAHRGVVVIPQTTRGTYLMVKQYRHGVNEIMLELPAGSLNEGENEKEAAERELLEETGAIAKTIELLGTITPNPSFSTQQADVFLAYGVAWKQPQQLDPSEEIEVVEMSLDMIKKSISNGTIWASDTLAAILLFVLKQQKWKKWD